MRKLIESCRLAEVSRGELADRYCYRFHPYGWMIIYVDHWGVVTINSDWGTWGHAWGGGPDTWGHPTFHDFLKSMSSPHYMADKLSYGRTRQVPDPEATEQDLRAEVLRLRRLGAIDKDVARELWGDIENFCEGLDDSLDVGLLVVQGSELLTGDHFDCLHEWVREKTAPKVVLLIEELLPVFLAHLRGTLEELTAREWDERHGRKSTTTESAPA